MSNLETPAGPPSDAQLILLQQISNTLRDHGKKLDDSTKEQHGIRETLAVLNERSLSLQDLPKRLAEIEGKRGEDNVRITGAHKKLDEYDIRLKNLETQAHQQQGWMGPLGKVAASVVGGLLVLLLGGVLAMLGLRTARAGDLRTDQVANQKCWAAPATSRTPKHLYL